MISAAPCERRLKSAQTANSAVATRAAKNKQAAYSAKVSITTNLSGPRDWWGQAYK